MTSSLTVNRAPIALHASRAPAIPRQPWAELATLTSEVAERLDEMDEVKRSAAFDLIARLASLGNLSPIAQRITIRLLHGNPEPLQSFYEQAKQRGITKQCVHHELHNEIAKIRRVFPELAHQLEVMRAAVVAHEDPMSTADSLRASVEGE